MTKILSALLLCACASAPSMRDVLDHTNTSLQVGREVLLSACADVEPKPVACTRARDAYNSAVASFEVAAFVIGDYERGQASAQEVANALQDLAHALEAARDAWTEASQ